MPKSLIKAIKAINECFFADKEAKEGKQGSEGTAGRKVLES